MNLLHPRVDPRHVDEPEAEALIREARRLRRRRWVIGVVIAVVIAGGSATLATVTARSTANEPPISPPTFSDRTAPALPVGSYVPLKVAGPLAVAPDGRLYVADTARDQVLVRLANGRFRVIAGDGKVGFSGDGGPAPDAELSSVSDMAFAPNGSLYLADGDRVRVVEPSGVIRTVAGNGVVGKTIATGTLALSAPIGGDDGLSIAFSPSGVLYISRFSQVLRLVDGKLYPIRAIVPSGLLKGDFNYNLFSIAVSKNGDVYVSGFNGWSVWKIAPSGVASEVGLASEARQSGGAPAVVQRGPNGDIYAEGGSTLLRVTGSELVPALKLLQPIRDGSYFWLTNFAFAPNGTVYADEIPGGRGFEQHQQLLAVRNGHPLVLWQESNKTVS